ncbi:MULTISPECIES: D-alanyl-D-alanine carboxypeptidase family protein [Ramlibacter]|uniref:serine-type D-Ala-D-Ala carboxypeptidase n=1 Tax=Ramlibacter aquaticus TaxID=2780094 RepID=A0ABR9SI03_9BURK|nr:MULTISPECIES: D-alanyl-D-alanine carboxypeptidase family protein [Ramlibacter]MBE7941662.1 D-alanyl-D-alanine carboxypeptidase [Ramlibacter aquaticus]
MRTFLQALAAPVLALCSLVASAQVPQPPEIAARNFLLVDVSANQVLAGRDADAPVDPAALTKLMSAYLVFDALRSGKLTLQQRLAVSARAAQAPGTRMFIDAGAQVPVEDLVKGMVVQSGNDATLALAEAVGGTVEHFVELMNAQGRAMGLRASTFKNPLGLPEPGHLTTARDLATVATRLLQDFPQYTPYYAIRKYRYQGTPTANDTNRNTLLFRDPTVDGLKTAHSDAAGFCVVATARRDFPNMGGRRLLAVVLGAASETARASEAQKLLNWGYTAWEGVKLFDANQAVVTPPVWKGAERTARLGSLQPVVVAVPAGTAGRLRSQVARPDPLIAPLAKGQAVGVLKVSAADQPLLDVPLVALDTVEQAGLLRRAWDAVRLWIK